MSSNAPLDPQDRPDSTPPAYAAPPAAPAYSPPPSAQPAAKGPATLGVVAFVVAVAGALIGSILGYVAGLQLGPVAAYGADGTTLSASDIPADVQQSAVTGGILVLAAYGVMAVLALWGLIQGIVAAVKNRGRGWAIAAIVVAVIAFLPVSILFGLGTAAGLAAVS